MSLDLLPDPWPTPDPGRTFCTMHETPDTLREALVRTATKYAPPGSDQELIKNDPSLAAFGVLHQFVHHLSVANLGSALELDLELDWDTRQYVIDWTLFFVASFALLADMEAEGLDFDFWLITSMLASVEYLGAGDSDAKKKVLGHRIDTAQRLAKKLVTQADEEPDGRLQWFVEAIWTGVRVFAWSGDEKVLVPIEPLYMNFVRLMTDMEKDAKPNPGC